MSTTGHWLALFSEELGRRGLPDDRIGQEVATVESHLRATGEDPADSFGDPLAYAADLAPDVDDDSPAQGMLLSLFLTILFFVVFVISTVRWIDGDPSAAPWSLGGGLAFLTAVAALSLSLNRRAIATALRDTLSQRSAAAWRISSSVLLLIPWLFVLFAAIVPALAALT